MFRVRRAFGFALIALLAGGSAVAAQTGEAKLPGTIAWSAYDVGSAGYNQAVAIGNALKTVYGINLRVIPGKNDVSRNLVLREDKVQFSATGVGGAYLAQEGVFEFGARAWGPQPVRALLLNKADQYLAVAAAGDVGIKTIADLKGKRVAWVIGSPSLNQNITALLAFSGLTWDDVQKVEFGGYGAAWEGIMNNQADVAFTSSVAGHLYKLASSPRGLVHPVVPHDDKEGWKRLQERAPFFVPVMATEGAEISEDKPVETAAYPYPILITYANRDDGLVYNMTKAMIESFDHYKGGAPGASGWSLDRQVFDWVIPWHDGAIRYFKEIGAWKPEHQAHNEALLKRQEILMTAWQQLAGQKISDDDAFAKAWMKARADALTKTGLQVVVPDW